MCLAVPGKIIEIRKDSAIVDYGIKRRKCRLIDKNYKPGDYVIVQGGIVVQKVMRKEAKEALRLYKRSLNLSIKY